MVRYKGEILIILAAMAWGASYLFVKTALLSLNELNLVALRFAVACVATALVFHGHARRIGRNEIVHGIRLGALLFASASLLAAGVKSTTISNAGFLIGSMILFVAIMETAISRTRPHNGLIAGIVFAMVGIGILTLRGELSISKGDLYCLGASIVLAIHVMAAHQAARRAEPIGASIAQFGTTAVLAWAALLLFGYAPTIIPGEMALFAVLGAGIIGTAIAFVCQVVGQRFISSTRTAFLFTLEPVFATVFAWLFMHEPVTWHVYAGGGLLLTGVYVSEFASSGKVHSDRRTIMETE